MNQESLVFKPPSHENPIIYAKSWFGLHHQLSHDQVAELPVEVLTARLQQLHIERERVKSSATVSKESVSAQVPDDEDDEFESSFGRELSYLLNQLRIRNLDVKELPFMPYIY